MEKRNEKQLNISTKDNQIWRAIEGFPKYSISEFGDIKRNDISTTKVKTLGNNGYYSINLYNKGKHVFRTIHRLVAIHFLPNTENKPCVNHKDGDKLNNHYSNLEWCTHSENNKHAYDNGLTTTNFKRGINSKEVTQYDLEGEVINVFPSVRDAANKTGLNERNIAQVCRGERNKHGGFSWSY